MATNASTGEVLAGGTDVLERRRSGVASVAPSRLPLSDDMRSITWRDDGGAAIGAAVTIDTLARDARVVAAYPALTATAAGLATPEIRRMATVGGNLTQRTRCWYFRHHAISCLKKGGSTCPARDGNHLYGVVFDRGPCVAPHPSSLGAALMIYDARVETSAGSRTVADVFGDGQDGTRDHLLAAGELIRTIVLPPPVGGERAHYHRATSRAHAEWPLVEVVARLVCEGGIVRQAGIALGGVAPVPIRLPNIEAMLTGQKLTSLQPREIAKQATEGAKPLPMTGYKLALIEGLMTDAIERLCADVSSTAR